MAADEDRYWRLDLSPDWVVKGNRKFRRNEIHHWSPKRIFAEDDLYTTRWGAHLNTDIEEFFFGEIDREGLPAVEFFAGYDGLQVSQSALLNLMRFMSVQRLRTPKGLAQLEELGRNQHRPITLHVMQRIQHIYCAIWTECVWQIASAQHSAVKFIISDHPVTVYNRRCPPLSKYCQGPHDPDIRLHATHTFFPLTIDKALILTNLSWARNPYQNELRFRPNPNFFRDSIFNFTHIQTHRYLTVDEVQQMNFVTKMRASRYIAAAEKDWLYPERSVSTDHWKKLGDGLLFMPEPRLLHMGGQVFIGYKSGRRDGFGEYGHKPWQPGYEDKRREKIESVALERFKAEWALKFGPKYVARDAGFGHRQIFEDSEDIMDWHRKTAAQFRKGTKRRR